MIKYCLDSGVFINSWKKHYPPEMFECVWTHLDRLLKSGMVFSPEEVFDEVHRGGDGVSSWVKARKRMIVAPRDEEIIQTVSEIVYRHPKLTGEGTGRSGADPWVIAHAHTRRCSVVTEELPTRNINKPKIPDVCVALGVECINTVELLRRTEFNSALN